MTTTIPAALFARLFTLPGLPETDVPANDGQETEKQPFSTVLAGSLPSHAGRVRGSDFTPPSLPQLFAPPQPTGTNLPPLPKPGKAVPVAVEPEALSHGDTDASPTSEPPSMPDEAGREGIDTSPALPALPVPAPELPDILPATATQGQPIPTQATESRPARHARLPELPTHFARASIAPAAPTPTPGSASPRPQAVGEQPQADVAALSSRPSVTLTVAQPAAPVGPMPPPAGPPTMTELPQPFAAARATALPDAGRVATQEPRPRSGPVEPMTANNSGRQRRTDNPVSNAVPGQPVTKAPASDTTPTGQLPKVFVQQEVSGKPALPPTLPDRHVPGARNIEDVRSSAATASLATLPKLSATFAVAQPVASVPHAARDERVPQLSLPKQTLQMVARSKVNDLPSASVPTRSVDSPTMPGEPQSHASAARPTIPYAEQIRTVAQTPVSPVPGNEHSGGIVQSGTATPQMAASFPASAMPQDLSAIVDRLVAAREVFAPAEATLALDHADFGEIELRFEQGNLGDLAVELSGADPELGRIVAASQTGEPAPRTAETPGSTSTRVLPGERDASGSAADQRARDGRHGETPTRHPAGERKRDSGTSRGNEDGIFA